MGIGALAAQVAVLDELLRVVPGAAARGHGDGHEQPGDDGAEKHRAERRKRLRLAGDQQNGEIHHHRSQHRKHGRKDHFLDRRLGQHVHAGGVVGFRRAFHEAVDFPELAADFYHQLAAGAAHGHHGHGAEEEGQQAADEEADDDERVLKAERYLDIGEVVAEVLGIDGEQHQRRKTGGADGVALGHRLGGVADGVEGVGDLAHVVRQVRHLGDAPRVVGDRAEGVQGDDDAGKGEHGGGGDGQAEQAGAHERDEDPGANHQHRRRRRLHGDRQALDDVGGVAGGGGVGDALHRAVVGARIVFGDPDDQAGDRQAGEGANQQLRPGNDALARVERRIEAQHPADDAGDQHGRDQGAGDEALVQRPHDVLAGAEAHEERRRDRGRDADRADGEGQFHHDELGRAGEENGSQHHGRHHRHRIGLEKVGGHAGAVAHIVAHVVGDDAGVAGIVLGNAGLDLADQIGAHVGALGEDAAAETGENGDQRSAEAERHQGLEQMAHPFDAACIGHAAQDHVVNGHPQQGQPDDQHAGHGAGLEREPEGSIKAAGAGRLGGAHVGPDRDVHADVAGGGG